MLSVVTLRPGQPGRHYRLPTERDYDAVLTAQALIGQIITNWRRGGQKGLCPVPDETTPAGGGSGAGRAFSLQKYGMRQWGDLFTARQKVALVTLINRIHKQVSSPATNLIALVLSKFTELSTANCPWEPVAECPRKIFNMQAIPTRWEFAEGVVTSGSSGGILTVIENVAATLEAIGANWAIGQTQLADACEPGIRYESCNVWFTDPPYYDAVPYADLSDFFFVWLKRASFDNLVLRDPTDPANSLTPKSAEIVQDETKQDHGRTKDRIFFEGQMAKAFLEGRRVLREDGIGAVVFAHKTTEGWEALLSGLIRGGWTITASWPIATEQAHRPRARESAALATSVHLICRPRPDDAQTGDWGGLLRELPNRVGDWMERLQSEGVRGADLVFACIGPALEIFSRYTNVETAEGREVGLPEYLGKGLGGSGAQCACTGARHR